jgi:hypothetical protein
MSQRDYVNIRPKGPVKRSKRFNPNWDALLGLLAVSVAGCVTGAIILFCMGLL